MILYSKQLCTIVEGVEAVVCLLVEVISPLCGNSSTAVVSPAETGKLAGKWAGTTTSIARASDEYNSTN